MLAYQLSKGGYFGEIGLIFSVLPAGGTSRFDGGRLSTTWKWSAGVGADEFKVMMERFPAICGKSSRSGEGARGAQQYLAAFLGCGGADARLGS